VRGYKEKGNINTPLEMAFDNEIDRFSLAKVVIDRVLKLLVAGAHVKDKLLNMQIECRNYVHEHGVDKPEFRISSGMFALVSRRDAMTHRWGGKRAFKRVCQGW
jgi:phosphoketolase